MGCVGSGPIEIVGRTPAQATTGGTGEATTLAEGAIRVTENTYEELIEHAKEQQQRRSLEST